MLRKASNQILRYSNESHMLIKTRPTVLSKLEKPLDEWMFNTFLIEFIHLLDELDE